MTNDEIAQKLIILHTQSVSELNHMHQRGIVLDRYEDYERGYANGFEEATESLETMIDDLHSLIRELEIDSTRESTIKPSEKQNRLL